MNKTLRCQCGRMIGRFDIRGTGIVEIRCKCKAVNSITISDDEKYTVDALKYDSAKSI